MNKNNLTRLEQHIASQNPGSIFGGYIELITGRIIAVILALLPFHAFLTVWVASATGHYTLLRLWKEILLVILCMGVAFILLRDKKLLRDLSQSRLVQCIVAFLLLELALGLVAYGNHDVTLKALGYGWVSDTRYLVFFLASWVISLKQPWLKQHWQKLVFWPLAVVSLIGLLQYFVLPYDVLKHFGYGESTIFPYETINHNLSYIRVMSTLRGANPLGAYTVLMLSLLMASGLLLNRHQFSAFQPFRRTLRKLVAIQRRAPYTILMIAGLFTLVFSFSRSAWIGAVLSGATVLFITVHSSKYRRLMLPSLGILAVFAVGMFLILRHNVTFQNAIFHTQDNSKVATSSNEGHASALKSGLKDIAHQPLGEGPGTAGPASAYNLQPRLVLQPNGTTSSVQVAQVQISENYFIQIGQELGVVGLALFLAINALLARELWVRRTDSLALGLFAALIGLSFVNLLSHAWADDTLAYVFWGLAGIALAIPVKRQSKWL